MKGKFSKNPIIFLLDILCCKVGTKYEATVFDWLVILVWGINILTVLNQDLLWIVLIPFTFVTYLYRIPRNRYLQKHNLPGPFGSGTIDWPDAEV